MPRIIRQFITVDNIVSREEFKKEMELTKELKGYRNRRPENKRIKLKKQTFVPNMDGNLNEYRRTELRIVKVNVRGVVIKGSGVEVSGQRKE